MPASPSARVTVRSRHHSLASPFAHVCSLAPGSSILDDPVVKANSKLKDYEHGRGAA
jgi:hypothetical protein